MTEHESPIMIKRGCNTLLHPHPHNKIGQALDDKLFHLLINGCFMYQGLLNLRTKS